MLLCCASPDMMIHENLIKKTKAEVMTTPDTTVVDPVCVLWNAELRHSTAQTQV